MFLPTLNSHPDVNLQTVVGHVDSFGKPVAGFVVVELMAGVRQQRAFGTHRTGHIDGFLQIEMSRMGFHAQGADDEGFHAPESFQGGRRDEIGVGAIGEIPDAKSEHLEVRAVLHRDRNERRPQDVKRRLVDASELQLRSRSRVRVFSIGEGVGVGPADV